MSAMKNEESRVLIVDDMPINRIILSSLLAAEGIEAEQAETGLECIELCRKKDYDLILLDHRMPDFDGVDTLMELKSIFKEREREIPIVCHTIEEGRRNINLYKAAGFADVLIKPIEAEDLTEILNRYLPDNQKRALERQNRKEHEDVRAKDELDKLPVWLKTIPHIDLAAGIEKNETAEDYLDSLYIFASSADKKAKEIENLCEAENWELYSIKLHSLKSMTNLIGARHLSMYAAELESASRERNIQFIIRETPAIVDEYRLLGRQFAPILKDERESVAEVKERADKDKSVSDISRNILFIQGASDIVSKGLVKTIEDNGFMVIPVPAVPSEVVAHRNSANIVLYYPGGADSSDIRVIMNFLDELFEDDGKTICLAGEPADIEDALEMSASDISFIYQRPIDMQKFINDINLIYVLQKELHRKKKIYVTDDDNDYRSIIKNWLADSYIVNTFANATDTIDAVNIMTPDLLLLDYEMPETDGYELMKKLRGNPATAGIPVIFLTGKNDKEHVFKILEHKPDGYLLKSTGKDTLKDAIHKFFRESIFNISAKEALK